MSKIMKENETRFARVKLNYQVTIPKNLRKKFDLSVGDYVKLDIQPFKFIPADQEYFFTKEWQKGETKADKEIAEGRVAGPFKSADALIKELES